MKKLLVLSTVIMSLSTSFVAHATQDNKPNPSDLTQVNSFIWGQVDNEGKAKVNVGIAGQYSEGNSFMGLVEHSIATKRNGHGKHDQNSRLRYFQVLDTGLEAAPQTGFSIDYMKGWKSTASDIESDIVALGSITKVKTPWDAFTLYPNVAYVTGELNTGDLKQRVNGYQINLFSSFLLAEDGKYIAFQPQWTDTNLGSKLEIKTIYGHPITAKLWVDISHTYLQVRGDNIFKGIADHEHKFEVGISYYF